MIGGNVVAGVLDEKPDLFGARRNGLAASRGRIDIPGLQVGSGADIRLPDFRRIVDWVRHEALRFFMERGADRETGRTIGPEEHEAIIQRWKREGSALQEGRWRYTLARTRETGFANASTEKTSSEEGQEQIGNARAQVD